MFTGYLDCARKAAAQQWRKKIEKNGITLAEKKPSVGSVIGTDFHRKAAALAIGKREQGVIPSIEDLDFSEFREEFAKGVVLDPTTNNRFSAEIQIEAMVREVANHFLPRVEPVLVEYPLMVDAGDNWIVSTTVDLVTADGTDYEHKTSSKDGWYAAQMGVQAIILESHGFEVDRLIANQFKRAPAGKPQPAMIQIEYDLKSSKALAYELIDRMKSDYARFDATGRPDSFLPNPNSFNCSQKYCPAFNSGWCAYGKQSKEDQNTDD